MTGDSRLYRLLQLPGEMAGYPEGVTRALELLDDPRGRGWAFSQFAEALAGNPPAPVFGTPRELLDRLVRGGFVYPGEAPPRAMSPDYVPPSRP
jgi:hypothetical protein